jgi:hypothetical protein
MTLSLVSYPPIGDISPERSGEHLDTLVTLGATVRYDTFSAK